MISLAGSLNGHVGETQRSSCPGAGASIYSRDGLNHALISPHHFVDVLESRFTW